MGVIAIKVEGGQVVEVITSSDGPDVYVMDIDRGDTKPQEFDQDHVLPSRNPCQLMVERHMHPQEEEVL